MKPGQVIGRVVATQKYEEFKGERFLVVQPMDWSREPAGEPLIATDSVGSGAGEFVVYVESREAGVALGDPVPPSDASICAIIDGIDAEPVAGEGS